MWETGRGAESVMRDLLLVALVFGAVPWALTRPYLGVYLWAWIGYMNPHKLTYGFAITFPWAQVIAITTLLSLLISREPKRLPITRETIVLILLIAWMTISTIFAIYDDRAWVQWEKVIKIQVMTFLTLMVINSRERLDNLIWVVVLSLGFYGFKGGLFTLAGSGGRVQGPADTFIAGNNELALALIVTIPLMWYLRTQASNKWIRHGLMLLMLLTAISAIGSQSRGALVGIVAMGTMLWMKSRQKALTLVLIALAGIVIVSVMPGSWFERMGTIKTYQEDESALGRINAWHMAFNVATQRLTGGGFEVVSSETFMKYAPDPLRVHDFHSIYFEILGEQGFIGLALFLLLFMFTWFKCARIAKEARRDKSQQWAAELARMLQVSLVGYAMAGAFLGMAYFDLPYHIMAMAVILFTLTRPENAVQAMSETGLRRHPGRSRQDTHKFQGSSRTTTNGH